MILHLRAGMPQDARDRARQGCRSTFRSLAWIILRDCRICYGRHRSRGCGFAGRSCERTDARRRAGGLAELRCPAAGVEAELIVVHGISLPPGEFGGPWIDRLFTNTLPADRASVFCGSRGPLRVSSHLVIRRVRRRYAVRQLQASRVACRQVELSRPGGMQRFFDRHRTRRHRYAPL